MIKSINQLVTYECNSKCQMCLIWTKGKDQDKMTPEEFNRLYSRPEFKSVADLCISGGEPTMREDLPEVMGAIMRNLDNLEYLFLSTNCSNPEKVIDFLRKNSDNAKNVYACVSLEGDRDTHKKIRGVDTYDLVVETLRNVQKMAIPNVKAIISSTIQPLNANRDSLEHISRIAQETGSTYSFRPVMINETFYANGKINLRRTILSKEQEDWFRKFMEDNKRDDPFIRELIKHMSGEETVMGNRINGIKCLAGDISVFIKSDGTIYPCINSTRVIGNKDRGIYDSNYKLGDREPCPCCTECQIYPMLNYQRFSSRRH